MLPCVRTNQGMKKTWVLECSAEGWNPSQIPPSKKEIHVGLSPKNGPNSCSSSMLIIILPTEKARKGCPKKTNHVLFLYSSLFRLPTWWSVAVCQSGSWSAQAGEEGTSSHSQTRAQVETCQLHHPAAQDQTRWPSATSIWKLVLSLRRTLPFAHLCISWEELL